MSEDRGPQAWAVYALIAANVTMFAVEIATGANPISPSPQAVIALGGNYPPLTLDHDWWRLGSSMFLHFGVLHVAMNMLCLYQVRAVELVFGRVGFLVIYFVAGLIGGAAALLVNPGNVVIAGASGAVFGAYGALGAKLVLHRAQFPPEMWSKTMRRLGTFLALNALIGIGIPGISLSAHAGGLIAGIAIAVALLVGADAERRRLRRALAMAAIGVALSGAAVLTIEDNSPTPVLRRFDAIEHDAQQRHIALDAAFRAGQITQDELGRRFEAEVVAPYRHVFDEVRALRDPPETMRPMLARIDELMSARLASWAIYTSLVHEADPARHPALMERYKASQADVVQRLAAVTAAIQALQNKH